MANDLRNLKNQASPGTAGSGAHGDAKPVPADARKSGDASAPGAPAPDFLAGLDAFSRRIDEEQKAHERAEAERRRMEEEETRRKVEAERVRQAQVQAQGKAEAEKQNEGRRFAALDMLRKQAANRPAVEDTTTESPYRFIHLQQASPMALSSAFADYRLRKVDGDEVCDEVFLTYQARYAQPATVDVAGADMEYCRRYLASSRVPFEFSASKKNDFGQAVSGRFTLSGAIPCEIHIRADYDAPAVLIELLNVGSIGAGRCRLAPEAFNERFADEIAKHALGSQNEFAKFLTR